MSFIDKELPETVNLIGYHAKFEPLGYISSLELFNVLEYWILSLD
jgi:hypothetical protein